MKMAHVIAIYMERSDGEKTEWMVILERFMEEK